MRPSHNPIPNTTSLLSTSTPDRSPKSISQHIPKKSTPTSRQALIFITRLNLTKVTIIDISQQVKEGQEKWSKGINIDPDDINIKDINDFIQFKILEYKFYDFKDDKI